MLLLNLSSRFSLKHLPESFIGLLGQNVGVPVSDPLLALEKVGN
jgi:hypothetical protein